MLAPLLHPSRTLLLDGSESVDWLFDTVADLASEAAGVGNPPQVRAALHDQEARRSTVTPEGVGFPHALLFAARKPAVIPVIAPKGIDLPGAKAPATILFFLVGSSADPWGHIRTLARLSRCVVRPDIRAQLLAAPDPAGAVEILLREDARHV